MDRFIDKYKTSLRSFINIYPIFIQDSTQIKNRTWLIGHPVRNSYYGQLKIKH